MRFLDRFTQTKADEIRGCSGIDISLANSLGRPSERNLRFAHLCGKRFRRPCRNAKVSQRAARDVLEYWRGDNTAIDIALRFIDDHQQYQAGFVRGNETDK